MHPIANTSPVHEDHIKIEEMGLGSQGVSMSRTGHLHIGVTGHRDILEEIAQDDSGEGARCFPQKELVMTRLASQVTHLITQLELTQITLHTPIARGADRWVVEACRVAIAEHNKSCSPDRRVFLHVQIVLPVKRDIYVSLEDKAHRDEMNELLEAYPLRDVLVPRHCKAAFDQVVRAKQLAQKEKEREEEEEESKSEKAKGVQRSEAKKLADCHQAAFPAALHALSSYYLENCDVMLCLWDGIRNHRMGGTADVIDTMRVTKPAKKKGPHRCRSLLCLSVARGSNPYPSHEPLTWHCFLTAQPEIEAERHTFLSWVHAKRPIVLLVLALIVVLTGLSGYCICDGKNFFEALPVTISHLFLGSLEFSSLHSHHYLVVTSRVVGLIFFAISIKALLDNMILLSARWSCFFASKSEHDLICGLGWRGQSLLASQEDDSLRTIAIDAQPDTSAQGLSSYCNTPLLVEDAQQEDVLKKTGLPNTRRAFVCTGSDEVSMRIVHQLATQYAPKERSFCKLFTNAPFFGFRTEKVIPRKLVCTVGLESHKNFSTLESALPQGHHLDLRMFHTETATARLFLRNHHLDRFTCSPNTKGARVVIIGDSTMADVLMHQVITQGAYEEGRVLEVYRLLSNAREQAHDFVGRHPCYQMMKGDGREMIRMSAEELVWKQERVLPEITFHELPGSHRGFVDWTESHLDASDWVLTVIVAHEDPADSSANAERIAPALERIREKCDVALWFLFNTPHEPMRASIERSLDSSATCPNLHIRAFSDFLGICNRDIATGEEADSIAKRVNAAYFNKKGFLRETKDVEVLAKRQRIIRENWAYADKESSRQCADHCFTKQRIQNRFKFCGASWSKEKEIEFQAEIEHRRWSAAHLMQGYSPLTRIPSAVGERFKVNSDEDEVIDAWFAGSAAEAKRVKALRKQSLKHIDLIPFCDFDVLFHGKVNHDGEDVPTAEKEKDHAIVACLDDIMRTDEFDSLAQLSDS